MVDISRYPVFRNYSLLMFVPDEYHERRASLARQLEKLRQEEEMQHNMLDPGKHQSDW